MSESISSHLVGFSSISSSISASSSSGAVAVIFAEKCDGICGLFNSANPSVSTLWPFVGSSIASITGVSESIRSQSAISSAFLTSLLSGAVLVLSEESTRDAMGITSVAAETSESIFSFSVIPSVTIEDIADSE